MKYQDIQDALCNLARLSEELENQYIESEGEVTPESEALEAQKDAVADLLTGEGIDTLGRWLKSKEDELAMYKAEKATADRRIKSVKNTIDFVKAKVSDIMVATGMQKAKGTYYGFTTYVSEKTSLNEEELDERWLDAVTEAARNAGLPGYIDVALKTTATRVKEWAQTHDGQGDIYLVTDTADAVRFTKPRKAKED